MKLFILHILIILTAFDLLAQDVKLTPDMFEFSQHSITGVYLCTPQHVENGDCSAVDEEYYENLARITLGIYEIGLLEVNNSKTIAFKGPLSPGSASKLIQTLEAYPDIKTLVLSSQGGSEKEAYTIADYVESHQINTWVPVRRMCLSACASIFLSGKNKTLDGQLGLHTGQYQIHSPYKIRNLEAARETIQDAMFENDTFMMKRIRLFMSLDIPLEVIDDMISAKGDFLVFTSIDDLINYSQDKNYIKSFEEMSNYSKSQPAYNFEFNSYQQLF